jgi:hypothetical protein
MKAGSVVLAVLAQADDEPKIRQAPATRLTSVMLMADRGNLRQRWPLPVLSRSTPSSVTVEECF